MRKFFKMAESIDSGIHRDASGYSSDETGNTTPKKKAVRIWSEIDLRRHEFSSMKVKPRFASADEIRIPSSSHTGSPAVQQRSSGRNSPTWARSAEFPGITQISIGASDSRSGISDVTKYTTFYSHSQDSTSTLSDIQDEPGRRLGYYVHPFGHSHSIVEEIRYVLYHFGFFKMG